MRDLHIRDVPKEVILKIDRLARRHQMSRSEYIRHLLRNKAMEGEVLAVQERYESLVKSVIEVLEIQTEKMNQILERYENE